jgi:mRNA interferase MazF
MPQAPIKRGEIYSLNWGETSGSMEKIRPSLIVQNDAGNKYSPYTIVIPFHHETEKDLPITVSIPKGIGGLTKHAVADCGHIYTVLQEDLGDYVGELPSHYLRQVDQALRKSLQL